MDPYIYIYVCIYIYVYIYMYICIYIYIYYCTRTRLKSHHAAKGTSCVVGATKNPKHITTLKSHHERHFLWEFIAGANEFWKSHLWIKIKKTWGARSQKVCFEWKRCINYIRSPLGRWFSQVGSWTRFCRQNHWQKQRQKHAYKHGSHALSIGALVFTGR